MQDLRVTLVQSMLHWEDAEANRGMFETKLATLAGETDVLLLDEPFSALDYLTRLKLRAELARLLAERPCTTILVTHDIEEAAQLADRVLVLSERPATIQQELVLTTPRPREVTQPEVVEAIHTILAALGVE